MDSMEDYELKNKASTMDYNERKKRARNDWKELYRD